MSDLFARKHFERGRQFELQDRLDEAIECYETACSMNPGFIDPYYALARIEANRNRFETALDLLDRALAVDDSPQVREWRAYVNGRLRRYDDALADYEAVVEAGEVQARVNLGRMLLALRRYEAAKDVLVLCEEPAAKVLLDALQRYREFAPSERVDDARAVRYLFARAIVLGTRGDGGLRISPSRYQLLTPRHLATTLSRLVALIARRGWTFDAIAGDGPRHGPIAQALSGILGLPTGAPGPGSRVLLASAVLQSVSEAKAVRAPLEARGCKVMHFAAAFVPERDPSMDEPAIIGRVGRSAVPWYCVSTYSRMIADDTVKDGPHPGFRVGPPTVDPNIERGSAALIAAYEGARADSAREGILDYYCQRHPKARAFDDKPFRGS